jgi:hypothetical protein
VFPEIGTLVVSSKVAARRIVLPGCPSSAAVGPGEAAIAAATMLPLARCWSRPRLVMSWLASSLWSSARIALYVGPEGAAGACGRRELDDVGGGSDATRRTARRRLRARIPASSRSTCARRTPRRAAAAAANRLARHRSAGHGDGTGAWVAVPRSARRTMAQNARKLAICDYLARLWRGRR